MTYIEGFVAAVPTANRQAYRQHAEQAMPIFRELGVRRMVEAWGDEVPPGKVTDFPGAVQATPEETVVFSWVEYPSKEVRDAANRRMTEDPRMKEMAATMPFDGKRMICGGFAPIVDEGSGGKAGYVDGYIVAVSQANREAYRALASEMAARFGELGALRTVEAWGDDVPDGKLTDFRRAVKAKPDEAVLFSWVEWPSKDLRDTAWKRFMEDDPMRGSRPSTGSGWCMAASCRSWTPELRMMGNPERTRMRFQTGAMIEHPNPRRRRLGSVARRWPVTQGRDAAGLATARCRWRAQRGRARYTSQANSEQLHPSGGNRAGMVHE